MKKQTFLFYAESNIVHTTKNYTDYLTNLSEKTFFLTPTSPAEVEDIIKTLNLRKPIDPNNIPTKLTKYSKTNIKKISKQFTALAIRKKV